jgi:hypothetical protein
MTIDYPGKKYKKRKEKNKSQDHKSTNTENE